MTSPQTVLGFISTNQLYAGVMDKPKVVNSDWQQLIRDDNHTLQCLHFTYSNAVCEHFAYIMIITLSESFIYFNKSVTCKPHARCGLPLQLLRLGFVLAQFSRVCGLIKRKTDFEWHLFKKSQFPGKLNHHFSFK